ncbi:MAG: peroxiredoxin [Chloroflexi bacterium]|nr:peroxiredoxin [Chloroflexota bacterium]
MVPGSVAPEFALTSTDGTFLSPGAFRGRLLVLYFYPRDDTTGCTAEACSFRDLYAQFAHVGAGIVGVSPDPVKSHQRFSQKHGLPFPLLADPGALVCRAYGVWKEKSMYGRRYMGVERSTFVIDGTGIVRAVSRKVSVPGHSEAVLAQLRRIADQAAPGPSAAPGT